MMNAMSAVQAHEQLNDAARWNAVVAHDRGADGLFVYAVLSTGVFCRPSCPSRRPRRDRVRFFADPMEATAAGFRACKRCCPDQQAQDIEVLCRYIDDHLDEQLSLERLSRVAGLSPFYLQRKFKATLGITPREYAHTKRMDRFKASARNGSSVTEAVYEAGFGSSSRLYEGSTSQ